MVTELEKLKGVLKQYEYDVILKQNKVKAMKVLIDEEQQKINGQLTLDGIEG